MESSFRPGMVDVRILSFAVLQVLKFIDASLIFISIEDHFCTREFGIVRREGSFPQTQGWPV
jgi:hypothetical protein